MGPAPLLVCDTNVLVSAIGWRGPEREVYLRVRSGALRLATSPALLDELERVLGYPKFGLEDLEVTAFVDDVISQADTVIPRRVPRVIEEDPADDQVLACASAARPDWIVSGDSHLLALGTYEGIPIVTARQLLDQLDRPNGDGTERES